MNTETRRWRRLEIAIGIRLASILTTLVALSALQMGTGLSMGGGPPSVPFPPRFIAESEDLYKPALLPDGTLLLFALKTQEGVQVMLSRSSRDDGETWSEPSTAFRLPREAGTFGYWVILVDREGEVHFFFLNDPSTGAAGSGTGVGSPGKKELLWGNDSPLGRCDFGNPNGSPRPVGSFPANGYGLYDMVGTVWEWCEECLNQVVDNDKAKLFYEDTKIKDPRLNPICRGGSFKTPDSPYLYCAYRHEDPIDGRLDCIGFRVAIDVE